MDGYQLSEYAWPLVASVMTTEWRPAPMTLTSIPLASATALQLGVASSPVSNTVQVGAPVSSPTTMRVAAFGWKTSSSPPSIANSWAPAPRQTPHRS